MPSRASPDLGATPYSIGHQLYQKLENFTTQNSTKNLISSVSIRKKITTFGIVVNSLFIYIGVISTVFQLFHGSYPPILAIDSSK